MFLEQFPAEGKQHGWIEVICGSMFSGKTEELIRRIKRTQFANQSLLLFKPAIDNRYSENNVVSHQGNAVKANLINVSSEILTLWANEKVVAIDEAQFFDNSAWTALPASLGDFSLSLVSLSIASQAPPRVV